MWVWTSSSALHPTSSNASPFPLTVVAHAPTSSVVWPSSTNHSLALSSLMASSAHSPSQFSSHIFCRNYTSNLYPPSGASPASVKGHLLSTKLPSSADLTPISLASKVMVKLSISIIKLVPLLALRWFGELSIHSISWFYGLIDFVKVENTVITVLGTGMGMVPTRRRQLHTHRHRLMSFEYIHRGILWVILVDEWFDSLWCLSITRA